MTAAAPAVVQTAWARAVIDGLIAAGVRDLIVSPGSRSTPLLCAALASELRCRPVVDERTAAFFALGQIRVTGRPTATLCTSGSAAGHALPAVLEAGHAHLPLVVITADRPPALQSCGAPQAMDQIRLFGESVRAFADLGLPDSRPAGVAAARRRVAQLVHAARTPTPGPVHLNVPAFKPLEPASPSTDADHAFTAEVAAVLSHPVSRAGVPGRHVAGVHLDALAVACTGAERGLIVAGPAPADSRTARETRKAVAALCQATGFPVLAEAASQLRFAGDAAARTSCDAFEVLLQSECFTRDAAPDLIIQIGPAPISSAWRDFLAAAPPCPRWVLCDHAWHDPTGDAAALLFGDVTDAVGRLARAIGRAAGPPSAWSERFARANRSAWHHIESELGSADALTEPGAVRAVVAGVPDGTRLMLGNSLPIRDVDAWCPGRIATVDVVTQRGLNGIDGLIAGAAGTASVSESTVVLLLGDVSFAHDVGSLAVARELPCPLVIVVLDNNGGRIFDRLPIAGAGIDRERFEQFWRTPPACDVAGAAAAFGLPCERPTDAAAIAAALANACARPGASIIHTVVEPGSDTACMARVLRAFAASWPKDTRD